MEATPSFGTRWRLDLPRVCLLLLACWTCTTLPVRAEVYGTGFFISPDGHLVTNHHVVDDAETVEVRFEERWILARLIRKDPANDLAILKVEGSDFPCIPIQFSAQVQPGDDAFTVGFPDPDLLGFSPKTTRGAVSAMTGLRDDARFYQTTVAIQPGNSGGPLCDELGNVIAITTQTINPFSRMEKANYVPQNINYGLKVAYVRPLIESIPALTERLPAPSGHDNFRAAQQAVERSVVSIRTKSPDKPDSPSPEAASKGSPAPSPARAQYAVVYSGKEGVGIRLSPGSDAVKLAAAYPQSAIPLLATGRAAWIDGVRWIEVDLRGWMVAQNSTKRLLQSTSNGWAVASTSDGFVSMRTGPAMEHDLAAKVYTGARLAGNGAVWNGNTEWIQTALRGWVAEETTSGKPLLVTVP